MNDHASFIGAHERGLSDLMEEGIEIPDESVVLTYRDLLRDRHIVQLYPCRAAAEARAAETLRARRARRGGCLIRPLAEAVA